MKQKHMNMPAFSKINTWEDVHNVVVKVKEQYVQYVSETQ